MNNNELDNLVESFLTPKPTPKVMDLKELFALFEQLEKSKTLISEIEQTSFTPFIPSEKEVSSPDTVKKFNELVKDNKIESPDRQQFEQLLRQQLDNIVGSNDPVVKLGLFIEYLNLLKQNEIVEEDLSKLFAAILFANAILSMIREFHTAPSAAGFLYERFIAYFFHGVMPEGTPIEDVIASGGEKWSLKLKGDLSIDGSIDGMYEFFTKYPNASVKYLMSQKSKDFSSITNWVVMFNKEQFEDVLTQKGQKQKYLEVKKAQEINNLIKSQISDLAKNLKKEKEPSQADIQQLNMARKELQSRLVYQNSSDLRFNFTLNDLTKYLVTDEPLVLSLTVQDVEKITKNNSNVFNAKVKQVLQQVNTVVDKVNNYFLSGKKEIGNDALETVENLGTSLNDIIYGSE
jgi:DNA gyrase/topoisomerase IV subunit A